MNKKQFISTEIELCVNLCYKKKQEAHFLKKFGYLNSSFVESMVNEYTDELKDRSRALYVKQKRYKVLLKKWNLYEKHEQKRKALKKKDKSSLWVSNIKNEFFNIDAILLNIWEKVENIFLKKEFLKKRLIKFIEEYGKLQSYILLNIENYLLTNCDLKKKLERQSIKVNILEFNYIYFHEVFSTIYKQFIRKTAIKYLLKLNLNWEHRNEKNWNKLLKWRRKKKFVSKIGIDRLITKLRRFIRYLRAHKGLILFYEIKCLDILVYKLLWNWKKINAWLKMNKLKKINQQKRKIKRIKCLIKKKRNKKCFVEVA
jgi:hypothetical protein